ncbi:hypothetical protein GmHk_13G036314 [Glycine max]|nr:hypothetical protein GmHk_13G036314 [Glycine max]
MDAHPCHDGIHQLTLRQREVEVMIAGQDVAEQQRHPRLGQGSHVGAHDPHSSPGSGPGKILTRHGSDQRRPAPASYLFLKVGVLIVPELDASLSVERPSFDGLETLLMSDALETVAIKLRSGAGPLSRSVPPRSLRRKSRRPAPASYLFLKVGVLIVPELDASLSVERPSFDGLETLLMSDALETVAIKLRSGAGPLSRGVPPRSLRRKLFRSHFL